MNIKQFSMGPLQTNTYVLHNETHAIVIDPSFTTQRELNIIKDALNDLELCGILLTHGHIDHIAGVPLLLDQYDVPLYINPQEKTFLSTPSLNLSNMIPPRLSLDIDTIDLNEGAMRVGPFQFEILDTPGHTAGSQSFIFDNDVIVGDFIFMGSVGRMDFPTGSEAVMKFT